MAFWANCKIGQPIFYLAALLVCTFFSALKLCQCDFIFFSSCIKNHCQMTYLSNLQLFALYPKGCKVFFYEKYLYFEKQTKKWIWKRLVCILNCYFPRNLFAILAELCKRTSRKSSINTTLERKQGPHDNQPSCTCYWRPSWSHYGQFCNILSIFF